MELGIGISTVIIALILLFVIYRIGLIRLAQVATDKSITVAESKLQLWEVGSSEINTRKYGKISDKLDDKNITRSSYKTVQDKINAL
ncbi:MAG: hypothetical protein L3I99_05790 [Sulfurimonas sp.]|nr:hypothetical protein [Sulfurimonas sp.]